MVRALREDAVVVETNPGTKVCQPVCPTPVGYACIDNIYIYNYILYYIYIYVCMYVCMYLCTHVHPTALLKPSCSTKSPEEGRPKPQEVGQVIHGDQEPSPPSHLIWPNHWKPEAANPLDEFQKLSEEENQQEEEDLDVQGIHWRGWIRLFYIGCVVSAVQQTSRNAEKTSKMTSKIEQH